MEISRKMPEAAAQCSGKSHGAIKRVQGTRCSGKGHVAPWAVARRAPLPVDFSRQE